MDCQYPADPPQPQRKKKHQFLWPSMNTFFETTSFATQRFSKSVKLFRVQFSKNLTPKNLIVQWETFIQEFMCNIPESCDCCQVFEFYIPAHFPSRVGGWVCAFV